MFGFSWPLELFHASADFFSLTVLFFFSRSLSCYTTLSYISSLVIMFCFEID
ncbi:hypothetical protein MtrunA17_Chr5g0448381 [Medicago truncatula]|uniref:Transmembrane protein n=1 Tax=Medicago truncatula TaxID=3880 RepID=A0A396I3L4_MEDTR|nr:hypothetical protein MtrunA17_Chr5g0448381 [Medicago truncatula]